jgi:mRNA interferase MazF
MAITFHPTPGTLLECDYAGLNKPEMVKKRPVIIVSPRSRINGLVTVAPLSTTKPLHVLPWHYELTLEKALAPNWPELTVWIACDMLNTFHISRLDRFHARIGNSRKYYDRRVSDEELTAIRRRIAAFFSL